MTLSQDEYHINSSVILFLCIYKCKKGIKNNSGTIGERLRTIVFMGLGTGNGMKRIRGA